MKCIKESTHKNANRSVNMHTVGFFFLVCVCFQSNVSFLRPKDTQ